MTEAFRYRGLYTYAWDLADEGFAAVAGRAREAGLTTITLAAAYHAAEHGMAAGQFWPDEACPEVVAELSDEDRARKEAAFAAHGSQALVLFWFPTDAERFRRAPVYDLAAAPAPGQAHYDGLKWAINSRLWRERAYAALRALGGEQAA